MKNAAFEILKHMKALDNAISNKMNFMVIRAKIELLGFQLGDYRVWQTQTKFYTLNYHDEHVAIVQIMKNGDMNIQLYEQEMDGKLFEKLSKAINILKAGK